MSKIAFSSMFADVTPSPALRGKVDGAMLTGAAIDKTLRTIDLQMETRTGFPTRGSKPPAARRNRRGRRSIMPLRVRRKRSGTAR